MNQNLLEEASLLSRILHVDKGTSMEETKNATIVSLELMGVGNALSKQPRISLKKQPGHKIPL